MEFGFLVSAVGGVLNWIHRSSGNKKINSKIDYLTVVSPNIDIAQKYIEAVAKANLEVDKGNIIVSSFEDIQIAQKAIVTTIVDSKSGFNKVERYSPLIKEHNEISKETAVNDETFIKMFKLEKKILLTFASHLLEMQNQMVDLAEDEREQLRKEFKKLEKQLKSQK